MFKRFSHTWPKFYYSKPAVPRMTMSAMVQIGEARGQLNRSAPVRLALECRQA